LSRGYFEKLARISNEIMAFKIKIRLPLPENWTFTQNNNLRTKSDAIILAVFWASFSSHFLGLKKKWGI